MIVSGPVYMGSGILLGRAVGLLGEPPAELRHVTLAQALPAFLPQRRRTRRRGLIRSGASCCCPASPALVRCFRRPRLFHPIMEVCRKVQPVRLAGIVLRANLPGRGFLLAGQPIACKETYATFQSEMIS
jgi:hypothetical protein